MLFSTILSVLCTLLVVKSCPSSQWISCSEGTSLCVVPSEIKSGYIARKANSDITEDDAFWTMIPFTGSHHNIPTTIWCDGYGSIDAECCYYAMDNEFSDNYWGTIPYSDAEAAYFDFSTKDINPIGFRLSLSGDSGPYIYRVAQGNRGYCDYGSFPWFGGNGEECNFGISDTKKTRIPSAINTTWTICGNVGSYCYGLDPSTAYWVKMGSTVNGNQFYFQLIVASEGKFFCDAHFFDVYGTNPAPGTPPFCYISEPVFAFGDKLGQWLQIIHCENCAENDYKVTRGISTSSSSEVSNTDYWKSALTKSLSASITFGGFSGSASVELNAEQSRTVTNTMTNVITQSAEKEVTVQCKHDGLWQWVTSAKQITLLSATDPLRIESTEYFCADLKPRCPPGYCLNSECQECSQQFLEMTM